MNPIILIPSRMASMRLPNKPMALIGGEPMIVQVWRRAMEAKAGKVIVACDGEEIKRAVEIAGGTAILTDPNLPSGSDRIYAALKTFDPQEKHDIIINLQGDMPTLDPSIIASGLALMSDPKVDIATLAAPITNAAEKTDSAVVKVTLDGKWAERFSRQWQAGKESYHHIGIYIYRRTALEKFVSLPPSESEKKEKLEQLRAMDAGMRIAVSVVNTVPLGVDTAETLKRAQEIMGQKHEA